MESERVARAARADKVVRGGWLGAGGLGRLMTSGVVSIGATLGAIECGEEYWIRGRQPRREGV